MVRAFDDFAHAPLAPLHELDVDDVRASIDRRVLGDILDLACARGDEIASLRTKLAREPSIAGSKRRARA
jgi:hypothetical protein